MVWHNHYRINYNIYPETSQKIIISCISINLVNKVNTNGQIPRFYILFPGHV